MEFFWGLLHPLVLVILFSITGSISIIIPRLLSIFGGSLSIALLFILIKRHFNQKTAIAVSLFAIFFPITIFSNSAGMQEELGMPLILGALIAFPSYPIVSGVFLSFASIIIVSKISESTLSLTFSAEYFLFLSLFCCIFKPHLVTMHRSTYFFGM